MPTAKKINSKNQQFFTIKDAAEHLHVSTKTLRRWEAAGKLVAQRTEGGHRRYSIEDIKSFKSAKHQKKIVSPPTLPQPNTLPNNAYITNSIIEEPVENNYQENVSVQDVRPETMFPNSKPEEGANNNTAPELYSRLHLDQKKFATHFAAAAFAVVLLFASLKVGPSFVQSNLGKILSSNRTIPGTQNDTKLAQSIALPQVLQAQTEAGTSSFAINIDSIFRSLANFESNVDVAGTLNLSGNTLTSSADLSINPTGNALLGGSLIVNDTFNIKVGGLDTGAYNSLANSDESPEDAAIESDNDLYIGGDLEVDGVFVIGTDTINDIAGTGLQVVNNSLESVLGTEISTGEITNDTILEADLSVSNTASNGYALTYNSTTGGFTWTDLSSTNTPSGFTDGGTLITLTTTTDNVNIGGSTELGKLAIDGDTDEIQFLVQGNGTQTSYLAVFEQSDGTDLLTLSNDGALTLSDGANEGLLDLSNITQASSNPQGLKLPQGATLTNIASGGAGYLAYDTTSGEVKFYNGTNWASISGAASTLQQAYAAGRQIQTKSAVGDLDIELQEADFTIEVGQSTDTGDFKIWDGTNNWLLIDESASTITLGNTSAITSITGSDSSLINLSAVNVSGSSEGLLLPQNTDCSSGIAEGQICWDTDTDALYVGSGSSATLIGGNGAGDITAVGDVTTDAAFTETTGDDGNSLWFEGTTADSNETQLTAADPGSDITVTIPAIDGTLASLAGTQTFTGTKTFNDITIADTNVSFTGASTTFTTTGALSINTGGTITVGDGGDNIVIDSGDWDITSTGAITGATYEGLTISTTTGTFTLTNGKTLAVQNSLTFAGTDSDTWTFPAADSASGTVVGLTETQTLTNKTLTSPKIGTAILDTTGNELINLTATASAVNELTLANAAASSSPTWTASGADTNIGINSILKGTGSAVFSSTTATTDSIAIQPQSTSQIASNTGTITSEDLTDSRTWTFPDSSGTIALTTDIPTSDNYQYWGLNVDANPTDDILSTEDVNIDAGTGITLDYTDSTNTLTINATNTGDITAVGNCTTGSCFTGSDSDTTKSNSLVFEGSTSTDDAFDVTVTAADVTTDITYTLPDLGIASGTFAFLEGSQTFTGAKTFDDITIADTTIALSGATTTLVDPNTNNYITFSPTTSAVNYLTYTNAATGTSPTWTLTSATDSNIGLTTALKGTGSALFSSTTANTDSIAIKPQTSIATDSFTGTLTSADLTAARTWTFQDGDGTVAFTSDIPTSDNYNYWVLSDGSNTTNITTTATVAFTGGTGITSTNTAGTVDFDFDATELNDLTWGDNTDSSIVWTFDQSTGTDPTFTFSNNSLAIGANTTINGTTNSTGALTLGADGTNGSLVIYNNLATDRTVTFGPSASQTDADITYTLPPNAGTDNYVLTTNGSGVLAWESVVGGIGAVTGSGTENFLSRWDSSGTNLVDAGISDDGSTLAIASTRNFTVSNVNAASGSANAATLSGTLGAFDGSDTFRGLYLNYTNADHTGSSNNFYGIDIAGITGDAEATETALNIGSGWDTGITSASPVSITTGTSTPLSLIRSSSGQWLGFNDGTDNFGYYNSAGTPEGSIAADIGSVAVDTTNGTLYVKTTDTASTGWTALVSSASSPWTTLSNVIYNTVTSDDVAIGANTLTAPFSFDVSANELRIGDATNDANDPTITFYASNTSDSGSLSYNDSDYFQFSNGNVAIDQVLSIGTAPNTNNSLLVDRTFTASGGVGTSLSVAGTLAGAANTNVYGALIDPTGITIPAGTTSVAASLYLDEPNITATGTLTTGATLYVAGAPTEANNNYAIYVAGGTTALADGALLDLSGITQSDGVDEGLLLPTLDNTANKPTVGGFIAYDTNSSAPKYYDGGNWVDFSGASTTLQDSYNNDTDTGDVVIQLSEDDDSLIFRNPIETGGDTMTDSAFILQLDNLATGVTTSNFKNLYITNSGATFDTTGGDLTNYGAYIANTATNAGGGNNLTNIGLYVTASGAEANYALVADAGVQINTTSATPLALTRTSSGEWIGFSDGTDTFGYYNNAGTPEGVIAADKGSITVDTSSGTLYVKTTDTANTGWTALISSASSPWTTLSNVIYNSTTTDDVAIGASTLVAPFSVDVSGNIVRIGDGADDANDPTIAFYASNASATGSLLYTDSDAFQFSGGNVIIDQDLTVTGGDITGSNSDSIDIAELADATFTFIRNDSGAVTLTSADNDTDADLTLSAGGSGVLTLGDTGSVTSIIGSDINFTIEDGQSITASVTGGTPTADVLEITGGTSSTDGVDGISLAFGTDNASGSALHITPSYAGGATDALSYNVIDIDAFSPTNGAGTDTVRGINIGNLTDPGATVSSSAIQIGSGWDNDIYFEKGSNDLKLAVTAPTGGTWTLTVPALTADRDICTTQGNCFGSGSGSGVTYDTSTQNALAKFTSTSGQITASNIYDTGTLVTINNAGDDVDLNIQTDTNANALNIDAGLFGGVGQLAIGSAAQGTPTAFVVVDNPAITATSDQNFYKTLIDNNAAITVTGSTTSDIVASLAIKEPNITATGTVNNGVALYIADAPTEGGTANYALWVDSGTSRLDGDVNLPNLSTGSGAALCVDGSDNVVTCTTGTGGISGSGAKYRIAVFDTTTSISGEDDFAWDYDLNRLTLTGRTAETTGSLASLTSAANGLTSGKLLNVGLTSTAPSVAFTGDVASISANRNHSAGGVITDTGNVLDLSRTSTISGAGTYEVQGPILNITNSTIDSGGTITDSANLVSITQDADATGALLYGKTNSRSSSNTIVFERTTGAADLLVLDDLGNLTIDGDLTLGGNNIKDSNGDTRITVGATTTLTNTTTTLSGTTTINAASATAVNLGAATVDFDGAGIIQYGDGSNFTIRDDGSHNILALNGTTNALSFGNATDNNTFNFLGTGLVTIPGNGDGNNALVLTTGNLVLTDGDLNVSGGDFNVVLDAGDSASIANSGSTGTAGALAISNTTAASNAGNATGASVALTLTNYADDGAADTRVGLDLTVTNSASDAGTDDNIYGLRVNDLGGGNNADGSEYAIYQTGTNWDYGLYITDKSLLYSSLQLGANGQDGQLILYNDAASGGDWTTTFNLSDSQDADITYTLPENAGTADNQVLTTDGTGVLHWESLSGVSGISGTGTDKQIAVFNGTSSLTSESSGFGWDYTNNLFTVGSLGTETTSTLAALTSSANTITSGGLLSAALTSASSTADFSGDVANFSSTRDNDAAAPRTDSGKVLNLTRTTTTNNAGATTNVTGAILGITNAATATLGTINDSANLVSISQDADATGALIYGNINGRTGSNVLQFQASGGGTDLLLLDDSGNLAINGDLTVTGDDIKDDGGTTRITFGASNTTTLTNSTTVLSGTSTITAASLGTFTTAATLDMTTTTTLNCTDCINFDDISDTLTLDGATTIASGTGITGTALDINESPAGTAATPIGLEITPSFGIDATDQTLTGLNINPNTNSNTDTGDILRAINIGNITGTAATETAINIGTGWDTGLVVAGVTVVNGNASTIGFWNKSASTLTPATAGDDIKLPDSDFIAFGTGNDLEITHNGTNSVITSTTGNLLFDNTNATGSSLFDLGTDTSATSFQVRNNSGLALLGVNGAGAVQLGSDGIDGQLILYNDAASGGDWTTTFNLSSSQDADITYTLPPNDGADATTQVLATDGAGNLTWESLSGISGVTQTGTNVAGYVSFFTDDDTITSNQNGDFVWDDTNQNLTLDALTTQSTQTNLSLTSASNAITSGGLLSAALTSSSISAAFTGDVASLSSNRTSATAGTRTDTGNVLDLSRTSTRTSGTYNVTGAILNVTNSTSSGITDSANLIALTQDADATGALIYGNINSRTGSNVLQFEQSAGGTNLLSLTDSGNLAINGDLILTGTETVTFGSGATINQTSDNDLDIVENSLPLNIDFGESLSNVITINAGDATTKSSLYLTSSNGNSATHDRDISLNSADSIYFTANPNGVDHEIQANLGSNVSFVFSATDATTTNGALDVNVTADNVDGVVGLDLNFEQIDGITAGRDAIAQKITLTQSDADGDLFGLQIINADTSSTGTTDDLITLSNNDTSAADGGLVDNAIKITSLGAGITTGININDTDVATAILLQQGEYINNINDNEINLGLGSSGTLLLTSDTTASITNSAGILAIDAQATSLDLQADGAIDVNLAGGSSATGCTITNSTGNLTCTGTITGSNGSLASTLQEAYNNGGDGNQTVDLASTEDSIIILNNDTGTDSNFVFQLNNTDSGRTDDGFKDLYVTEAGSFDTTAGSLTNYGGYFANTSTESGGGNTLTNIGIYATASGADANYAAIFDAGNVGIGTTTPGNKLSVVGSTSETSGTLSAFSSAANGLSSGGVLSASHTASSATDSLTGNIVNASSSRTNSTASQTLTDSGNLVNLSRTTITNNASAETDVTGNILRVINIDTALSGTLTDASNLVSITQDADATGALLYLETNRTDTSPYDILVKQSSGGLTTFSVQSDGDVSMLGDAYIAGGQITLGGTFTVTESSDYDLDITSNNITLNMDFGEATADQVSISSSDAVSLTSAGSTLSLVGQTGLALATNSSGDITATTSADTGLVNILIGNLKVGNGTPDIALTSGEQAYIEGTLEVDGAVQFDGNVTVTGGNLLDLSGIDAASTSSVGLRLPQGTTLTTTGPSGASNDGYLAYDVTNHVPKYWYNGAWNDFSGASTTLDQAYGNDVDGSDTTITLTSDDDSLIFTNPSSSGTDSAFLLELNQANTTAGVSVLDIIQASNGADAVNITADSIDTENAVDISVAAITTGTGINITGSGATMTTGGKLINLDLGANTVGSGLTITSTGAYTGTGASDGLINVIADSLTTGYGSQYSFDGLTTGTGINVTSSGTIATGGELLSLAGTGITSGRLLDITADADTLTSGQLLNLSSTATSITGTSTTGSLLNVTETGALTTSFVGNLGYLSWEPGSTASANGNLLTVNIGANGTLTGDLFQVQDAGSDLFRVNESIITSSLTHEFTAAGDIAVAYDLQFTNQIASNIKSNAPLTIEAGEAYESDTLTFKVYNAGSVIVDSQSDLNTGINGAFRVNTQSATDGNIGIYENYIVDSTAGASTSHYGQILNLVQNSTQATANLYGLTVQSAATTNATAGSYDCLLCLSNAENTASAVTDALRISSTSGTDTDITTAININSTNVVTDIALQNAETIDNNTDGTVIIKDGDTTTLISTSKTVLQANLDDTNTYTETLCHSGADGETGVVNIGDCDAAGGGDLAEYYGSDGTLTAGDIVEVDSAKPTTTSVDPRLGHIIRSFVTRAIGTASANTIGIVSTNPSIYSMGKGAYTDTDYAVPVAMTGRAPVKISDLSEAIVPGDYITVSSEAGKGQKATAPGYIVGRSLEAWTPGAGQDSIVVLIENDYVDPTASGSTADTLTTRVDSLETQVAVLESQLSLITGGGTPDDISTNKLTVNDTLISLGSTILSDTSINGKLDIGAIEIDSTEGSIDTVGTLKIQPLALGDIEFFGGLIVFDTQGNATVQEITAKKYNVEGESSGTSTITAGSTSVFVPTTAVTTDSLVFTNPKSPIYFPLSVTSKTDGSGFTVEMFQPETSDISFDWWIVDKVAGN